MCLIGIGPGYRPLLVDRVKLQVDKDHLEPSSQGARLKHLSLAAVRPYLQASTISMTQQLEKWKLG